MIPGSKMESKLDASDFILPSLKITGRSNQVCLAWQFLSSFAVYFIFCLLVPVALGINGH